MGERRPPTRPSLTDQTPKTEVRERRTGQLRKLPQGHRDDECLLWVGSSNS